MSPPTEPADLDETTATTEATATTATSEGTEHGTTEHEADATESPRVEQSWSWHAARVSGLFLAVLIPLHFAVVIIGGDVGHTTAGSMNLRFHDNAWRAIEWITLMLALAHGFLALRPAIIGSVHAPHARDALVIAVGVATVLLAIAATLVLVTYA